MTKRLIVGLLLSASALAACGRGSDRQGGLSAEENSELNNAAEMLDTSPDSLVPEDNGGLGNGDTGPMDAVDPGEAAGNAATGNAQ
ncbi:MAG TPA: hypothetical protein VGD66_02340 [Allosphingosinicella sp.]|jgi:hypothetical protein